MASIPTKHYDILTLGGGEGTKYIAWSFGPNSSFGLKTATIERQYKGGSCPNISCLPSKNIIFSAHAVHEARMGAFGLTALNAESNRVDLKAIVNRKNRMVAALMDKHDMLYAKFGTDLIWGQGTFVGPKEIEVTATDGSKERYTADTIIIGTGSRARIDEKIPGLQESAPLTHVEWLDLEELPEKLIVLGGGYVGLEMAQASARLGSKVTVVEKGSKILKNEDDDVTTLLAEVLTKEGIDILAGCQVVKVEGKSGSSIKVHIKSSSGEEKILEGSHLLVAGGRIPNTQNIGLDAAGVELTSAGHIKVDEHLRTTAPDIFAVGDCAGSPNFTHIGFDDFRIVKSVLSKSATLGSTVGRQVPSCLFTDPEVSHVGLTEREAKAKGIPYRLTKMPMIMTLRTGTMDRTVGFIKALIEPAPSEQILGFTGVGPSAGEMLPVIQLAMAQKLSYKTIANMIITHPTMLEGLGPLFDSTPAE
jgi:pyruvate/2-oxoglutarate dehydrogenase complex dihydrolipoamide dehydrogenase (E3) component